MGSLPDRSVLRRAALAVSVLDDIDIAPTADGLDLAGTPPVTVGWAECAEVVGDADPEGGEGRGRLSRHLLARRWAADRTAAELTEAARPVGLPAGHVLRPVSGWVRQRVLGNALALGLGAVGLAPGHPDDVIVVPDAAWWAAGVDPAGLWPAAAGYLERMGAVAAERWAGDRRAPLRPIGDCDVVTLLGSATFRAVLAGSQPAGMVAVAAPMRVRGWLDLRRIDPAFALAAAAATAPEQRGFARPVLVTAEEVALARDGGRPADIALRDPAADSGWMRDVLYR